MSARFSADWLRLREPADHAARSPSIRAALVAWAVQRPALRLLDLAAGTGSAVRALADHLPPDHAWLLVDQDADLLGQVQAPVAVTMAVADLADPGAWPALTGIDLVSMAALLDLVSAAWLEAWLDHQAGRPLLAALTYDGRMVFTPDLPGDELIRELINAHQHRDKGFGPALGPDAPAVLIASLTRRGYRCVSGDSAWRLTKTDRPLITALIDGWSLAALEQAPHHADTILTWQQQRHQRTDDLLVGHQDVFAIPP